MVKNKIIKILSAGLSSSAMAVYLTFISSLFSSLTKVEAVYSIVIGIAFLLILPFLPLFHYREKGLTDWDVTDRKKRPLLYKYKILGTFIATILFYLVNNLFMFKFSLAFTIVLIILLLVNYRWKISLHASGVTIGALSLYFVYGGYSVIFLALIPLVYWIRLKLKAHTISQLIAGTVVTAIVTTLIFI